ncbi:hypothetical protein WJX84_004175 [Apatococcus fuscideae]|uniref:Protein transport protein SEC23 n=1 Tax=Apatococcus fuscideae TaxID=2026836 RepID=A0AAW1TE89_9CHLO
MCSTLEYTLPTSPNVRPPAYVFVVDTCLREDELAACKGAITQALQMVPDYAQIGLITFGTHVHVHELGFTECAKSYVFHGSKEYTSQQGVLDELQRDAFPTEAEHRPCRCTGTAIQVAAGLMAACLPLNSCAARLQLFVGGPSTVGAGKVVERQLLEPIRSHKDLAKDAAPLFKKALRFYEGLSADLVKQSHSLDVFACALDQVGLAEMKRAVERSGGNVVQVDSFGNPVFKESFRRVFETPGQPGSLNTAAHATLEVIPSKDVKVSGALGPGAPQEKKLATAVADQVIGMGGTNRWKMAGLDGKTTMAFFFDIVAANKKDGNHAPAFFIQFITRYLHPDGSMRCRVTTVSRMWADGNNAEQLISAFDQECAAALVARLATHKMETEEDFDATRYLDRTLIRLASRFGEYRKDDASSFELSQALSLFPGFMFNLRRSQFVQVFGNSPDETAFCRLVLNKETTSEALLMLQPELVSYKISDEPEPVQLDVTSILPDRILLLDSYFYVVLFHGSTIASWRKAEYHLLEQHAAFKVLLEAPQAHAEHIVKHRFPVPKLVICDQNGSQARFLLARLNPSATYSNPSGMSAEVIMTDDVSLQVFLDHLRKLAVQS